MRIGYINYVNEGTGPYIHAGHFYLSIKKLNRDIKKFPEKEHNFNSLQHEPERSVDSSRKKYKTQFGFFRDLRRLVSSFVKKLPVEVKWIKQKKPDIVLIRAGDYLSGVLICLLFKIPVLLEINAPLNEYKLKSTEYHLSHASFFRKLEKKLIEMVTHTIVVSEPLRQYYINKGIKPRKITSVPNGVDVNLFDPAKQNRDMKKELGFGNKFVIGFSGHFSEWHGLDFLTMAIKKIVEQRDDVALLLIGKSKHRFKMPDIHQNYITMTGFVPYQLMPSYLAAIDIFVAPYPKIEPFYFSPLKIFEAMAMAKPVVASAQGQIRELIIDEKNGMLFPPGDEDAFCQRIEKLIFDPELCLELGRNARKRVISSYTWDHNARNIFNILSCVTREKLE